MKLAGKTNAELMELRRQIEQAPENKMPPGTSIWIYTAAARKKLDAIDRAITHNMAEKRKAEGNPVPPDGYSGRQTNRR